MSAEVRIGVILASVRAGRRGEPFAAWVDALVATRTDMRAELLDLREWPFPPYSHKDSPTIAEKSYAAGSLEQRWAERIGGLDGFVVVTPEYSHGYPGSLKNAIDQIYVPWNYKPIAFVSYGGFAGGARAVEQLRQVSIELRMIPVRDEVNLRLVGIALDERGWPTDELYRKRAGAMLDELTWMARVLRDGRAQNPR